MVNFLNLKELLLTKEMWIGFGFGLLLGAVLFAFGRGTDRRHIVVGANAMFFKSSDTNILGKAKRSVMACFGLAMEGLRRIIGGKP